MSVLKMSWAGPSESQFNQLRQRAISTGKIDEFVKIHNEIVSALRDVGQAVEKSEPLYHTRKPGGEVRKWVHRFIAVVYVVFPEEQIGWILKYQSVPSTWPDQ